MSPDVLSGLAFLLGLSAEFVMLIGAVFIAAREKSALDAFTSEMPKVLKVKSASRADRAVQRLRGALRDATERFENGLRSGRTLDESVTESVLAVARSNMRRSTLGAIAIDAALIVLALAPMLLALIAGALKIAEVYSMTRSLRGPAMYATALESIPPAFEHFRTACDTSALLLSGLSIVFAFRWLLLRPEVREARVIEAILRAAVSAKPGAPAPIGGRLARLLAPTLALTPALKASFGFILMVTAAWLLVTASTGLRIANTLQPPYQNEGVWLVNPRLSINGYDGLVLPRVTGGTPLKAGPSLVINGDRLHIAQADPIPLAEDGSLPLEWPELARSINETALKDFRASGRPIDMVVLVHWKMRMGTVEKILREVKAAFNVASFSLVVVRSVLDKQNRPIQAQLSLAVAHDGVPPDLAATMSVSMSGVRIRGARGGQVEHDFRLQGWPELVRSTLREKSGIGVAGAKTANLRVGVQAREDVRYEDFIAVLGAADTTCDPRRDCGFPGLGYEFVMLPTE